jgi:hypothetical protein
MSSAQFSEWLAYARLKGLPESRADFRSGQVCSVLANIHRDESAEPFTPSAFIPDPLREIEPPPDLTEANDRALKALFGSFARKP